MEGRETLGAYEFSPTIFDQSGRQRNYPKTTIRMTVLRLAA